jgi:hypothetical protein
VGVDIFARLIVESLAFMVFLIVCAIYLCGPAAVILAYYRWNIAAVLIGAAACWLGIFWLITVYTWFKYLGLASVACGLYAMYRAARNLT